MAWCKSLSVYTVVIICLTVAGVAWAKSAPLAVIKDSNDKVLSIYQKYEEIDGDTRQRIFEIMEQVTDFEEISNRTVKEFCNPDLPESCDRLKQVFKELLRLSAIRKLGRYRADKFDYLDQKKEGDVAVVKTTAYFKEDEISLDYIMQFKKGRWQIVNYIADEIDTVRNYRRQFARILKTGSLESLIMRLKAKVDEYRSAG